MAFFDTETPLDQSLGIDPNAVMQAKQEWNAFLGNPQGRAALLSGGLALMQPPSFGDNPASQIARAIGSAGESATANQATSMKGQELESKQDLRGTQAESAIARAGAAEARAGAAGTRSEAAADRLGFQRERLNQMTERNMLNNRVRLSNMYQQYVKQIGDRNASPLRTGAPEPVLPIQDWVSKNPLLAGMMPAALSVEGDDEEVPAAANTTSQPATGAVPPKAQRTIGKVYQTPKGSLKWNGEGWDTP